MANLVEIKRLMREVVGANPNLPISATVLNVDGDHCSVKLKSGLKLTNVKLKATIGNDGDYVVLTPKKNSSVVLLSLSGSLENLTVIKSDALEKMEYRQNGLIVLVDGSDGKVSVKNESASLFEILGDLTKLLKQLKVSTPVGPSGVPLPDSILALEQFETKFKQLLK